MKLRTGIPALAGALFVLLATARVHAQGSDAAATALFDEGRRLMMQHHYAEACPKLAESQRLAPSGGTLLNLADCYEHTGQTASAWVAWKDAAARANAAGKGDAEKKALARSAALEPGLARLTIAVSSATDIPGLEVKRDGVVVGRAEYGSAIPVDPGAHQIEASAPKKKASSTTIEVAPKQTDARVTVALADDASATPVALAPEPAPGAIGQGMPGAAPPPGRAPPSGSGSAQRVLGIVTLGVGVAGLAVGSVFGLVAISKNNDALQPQNCPTPRTCKEPGLALTSDAKDAATVSTIAFGVGAAAVVGGAVLWLTAPNASAPSAAVRIAPTVGFSYGGVSVDGVW
jgi:serine/threonine-protein kinase